MIVPKQVQRATEAFVAEVADAMRDVVRRLPTVDGRRIEQDVAQEAFSLVTALIDVDRSHTDDELWGVIFAFGRWMPDQLGRAKPDDLRRSSLLVGRDRRSRADTGEWRPSGVSVASATPRRAHASTRRPHPELGTSPR